MNPFRKSHMLWIGVVCLAMYIGSLLPTVTASAETETAAPAALEVDTAGAMPFYANFSRVTGTPEELIIDFGLNATPFGRPDKPIKADHRVVMNFYTAKRFATALQASVARHEAAFGPIETDVSKRVKR